MTRRLQTALVALRPRPAVPGRGVLDPSTTTLRVGLGDLDLYRHVNNGTYLQMMDVARTNLLADLGGIAPLRRRGWYPVVAAATVSYHRSLQLGERFTITTRTLGWDERVVYLEQVFRREQRPDDGSGRPVARAWVAGRFLARTGGRVPAPDVVELLGGSRTSPDLPPDVAAWARAVDVAHREA